MKFEFIICSLAYLSLAHTHSVSLFVSLTCTRVFTQTHTRKHARIHICTHTHKYIYMYDEIRCMKIKIKENYTKRIIENTKENTMNVT